MWQEVKSEYVEQLIYHPKSDLAESFYNSIFCSLFERKYYQNRFIFVESSNECLENLQQKIIYTRYEPDEHGLHDTIAAILTKPEFALPYQDLERDINKLIQRFWQQADKTRYPISTLKFDIIDTVFYRNKGAYIIGKVVSPAGETPFIVAILNDEQGHVYIDTLLTDSEQMAIVFGFARAYFFVDCPYLLPLITFLQNLMPSKNQS